MDMVRDSASLDSVELQYRTECLKLAQSTAGATDPDVVITAARKYWDFLKGQDGEDVLTPHAKALISGGPKLATG